MATEIEPGGGGPPGEAWVIRSGGFVLGVDAPDLAEAPLQGVFDRRATRHLREHVRDDERGDASLAGGRHRPRDAGERRDLSLFPDLAALAGLAALGIR